MDKATRVWRGHQVKIIGPQYLLNGDVVVDVEEVGGHVAGLTYTVLYSQLELPAS